MKKAAVYNVKAEKVKDIELNPAIFNVEAKESVVHQVAVAQMANSRVAIAHTKTRGEVRGGGAKPWRQKGTGRARAGSNRSPIWVGGGITFGPRKDRNFSQKVNKKMKTRALFMCLSDKVSNNLLVLLDKLSLENGKTKEVVEVIKNLKDIMEIKEIKRNKKKESKDKKNDVNDVKKDKKFDIKKHKLSLLVILPKVDPSDDEVNKKVFKAGRNIDGLKIATADSLNVVDLLKYEKVLMVEGGLSVIEKTYLKK